MEVCGQSHALAALPAGKTRYPLYRRLGGPQGRSGRERLIQAEIEAVQTDTTRAASQSSWLAVSNIRRRYKRFAGTILDGQKSRDLPWISLPGEACVPVGLENLTPQTTVRTRRHIS